MFLKIKKRFLKTVTAFDSQKITAKVLQKKKRSSFCFSAIFFSFYWYSFRDYKKKKWYIKEFYCCLHFIYIFFFVVYLLLLPPFLFDCCIFFFCFSHLLTLFFWRDIPFNFSMIKIKNAKQICTVVVVSFLAYSFLNRASQIN